MAAYLPINRRLDIEDAGGRGSAIAAQPVIDLALLTANFLCQLGLPACEPDGAAQGVSLIHGRQLHH